MMVYLTASMLTRDLSSPSSLVVAPEPPAPPSGHRGGRHRFTDRSHVSPRPKFSTSPGRGRTLRLEDLRHLLLVLDALLEAGEEVLVRRHHPVDVVRELALAVALLDHPLGDHELDGLGAEQLVGVGVGGDTERVERLLQRPRLG